jgi:hypothetical protein
MKRSIHRKLREQRGSSVVEFSIVAMLLVPLVLYSMYFTDLAKVRLKTQEIARYAAWEMTSYPLSDYDNSVHDGLFDRAAQNTIRDVLTRYGDDLRADTVGNAHVRFMTGDWELSRIGITNQEANIVPNLQSIGRPNGGLIGELMGNVNGGINWALGKWGFNTQGQVRVDVAVRFTADITSGANRGFMSERFAQEFFEKDLFEPGITTLEMTDSLVLLADSWTLYDGENVHLPGGYSAGARDSLFWKQVNRMVWMGFLDSLPGMNTVSGFMQKVQDWPIINAIVDPWPPATRVTSIASRGDDPNDANKTTLNVDCGQSTFHTTPIRDQLGATIKSEYAKTYQKRGEFYMGCPEAGKENCFR